MKIVFVDNHLLVVEKPAGIPTQKTDKSTEDLESQAKEWVQKKFNKPGAAFLHAVHRLDSGVSGLVLFARTSKALARLNALMRERKMKKTYLAWVEREVPEKEGTLRHFLTHGEYRAHVVTPKHPEGKEALLNYRVLEQKKGKTCVEINLVTGRYHQIRAQFSAIGCPIVGDKKYGSQSASKAILLHHTRLEFVHPVTHADLVFVSKPAF